MSSGKLSIRWLVVSALLLLGACQDATGPIGPPDLGQAAQLPRPGQDVAAWFSRSADEVLALPLTVFADYDEVCRIQRQPLGCRMRSLVSGSRARPT